MKNILINRLLLVGIFALTISSCDDKEDAESVISSFEKFPVELESTAMVVPECGNTYSFNFTVGENQVTDVTIEVGVGKSSTAVEDVDFILETHEVELEAFGGQDGFDVDITVLEDYEIEDGNEEIYLTFTTLTPSGVQLSETKVITIEDSGLGAAPSETVEFTLRWEFDDPDLQGGAHPCDLINDLDMTFQHEGETDPYAAADLLGYGAASLTCPETATLDVADMVEGEVYEVWILFYGGIDVSPDAPEVTVYVDFARPNSDFNGTAEISGVFDATMNGDGGVMLTIEKNCNVVTLKDEDGNTIAEGRVKGKSKQLIPVKKPI